MARSSEKSPPERAAISDHAFSNAGRFIFEVMPSFQNSQVSGDTRCFRRCSCLACAVRCATHVAFHITAVLAGVPRPRIVRAVFAPARGEAQNRARGGVGANASRCLFTPRAVGKKYAVMRAEGIFVQSSKVCATISPLNAEWSSLVARWAHNPKVVGSNPASATKY